MKQIRLLVAGLAMAAAVSGFAGGAQAQALIGSYWAYIGTQDLYNSKGVRLSAPWQVLRQDRANVHKFGISQPGDEWDRFFGSYDNRAAMEQMIMNGDIAPRARRILMRGGATVFVRIYGHDNIGTAIRVTVSN